MYKIYGRSFYVQSLLQSLTAILKVKMTFKRYSVIICFRSYPCALSKYAAINLERHSKCACAQSEFFIVSYLSNHWSKFVQILYAHRSWLDDHFPSKMQDHITSSSLCKFGPKFKPLTDNLKVKMTFKRYSVIVDFCSHPCTLSK